MLDKYNFISMEYISGKIKNWFLKLHVFMIGMMKQLR